MYLYHDEISSNIVYWSPTSSFNSDIMLPAEYRPSSGLVFQTDMTTGTEIYYPIAILQGQWVVLDYSNVTLTRRAWWSVDFNATVEPTVEPTDPPEFGNTV